MQKKLADQIWKRGYIQMDQIKIGEFIARKRKEQELTQLRFAELVGVSNKTVSKWETGIRLPDVALLQTVCDILKITINELLAGEEISESEFIRKTEDNVIGLVQELDEIKQTKISRSMGVLCSVLVVAGGMLLTMAHIAGRINMRLFFHLPTIFYMTAIFFLIMGVTGAFTRYIAGYGCWLKIRKYSAGEMDKIICTVEYAKKLIVLIALFVSLVNGVRILSDPKQIWQSGPFMSGVILSFFYMIIMEVIHDQILYQCKMAMLENGNREGGIG